MAIRLIVNADDYGRTQDVSRGIRMVHLKGIVTSTTCMMNLPDTISDIRLALVETPKLGMGVHLNLTAGKPILPADQVKDLCRPDGSFLGQTELYSRRNQVDLKQIAAEWRAQVRAFIDTTGRKPTHLDSHHHTSYYTPAIFTEMTKLAAEIGCPVRLPAVRVNGAFRFDCLSVEAASEMANEMPGLLWNLKPKITDGFMGDFYDQGAQLETLLAYINGLREGVFEIMCHPGYSSPELEKVSSYHSQREEEVGILCSATLRELLQSRQVHLMHYGEI